MNRAQTIALLRQHKPILARQFDVTDLALFGSAARNQANKTSDVDILVSFDGPASSARFFGMQFYLDDLLERPVDLVTDKALRPELKPYVTQGAVRV